MSELKLNPSSGAPVNVESLAESITIMARLRGPDGCPWDREQTFDTIMRHTLEETYEVFDAIDRRAWPELKDELGDLLLQVLFYSQMAQEAGYFSIEDVAANLNAKLIRRHPHIFGDVVAETVSDVNRNWEAIKKTEKGDHSVDTTRYMDDVPRHMPALLEAEKLGSRAAKVGFDWPDTKGLFEKIKEESDELLVEVEKSTRDAHAVADELGDLLFTTVNLSRHLQVEPEFALRAANAKFRRRFAAMEEAEGGIESLRAADSAELEEMWKRAKTSERAGVLP